MLVPPSTLVEVIRLPVVEARQRIIHALAKGPRKRLRTEAESESAEVVAEIRRVRPHWLRSMPDTAKVASLNNFWTNRIWRKAIEDSESFHQYQMRHTAAHDYLVANQKEQRASFIRDKATLRPLTPLVAEPRPDATEEFVRGWSGSPVEAWRVTSRDIFWYALAYVAGRAPVTGEDTTYADWIGAYVDLANFVRIPVISPDSGWRTRAWQHYPGSGYDGPFIWSRQTAR